MKQSRSVFVVFRSLITGLALFASVSVTGLAHADPSCSVPICDVAAAVEALRGQSPGEHFAMLVKYRNDYRNSEDLKSLENLADFAQKAAVVLTELKVEDYVIREAKGLYGEMLIGLAKYSKLDAAKLAGLYQQLTVENDRYTVITYWKGRIKDFDDKASLMALMDFFGRIGAISRASGDADYLVRDAKGAEEAITARIVQLYPYFEGVYSIRVRCEIAAGETAPAYCKSGFIDRLIIMDALSGQGLQVSLANGKTGTMIYTFANVLLSGGGTTFEGTGAPSGVLSELRLVLDRATGKVSGQVRNSDSLSVVQIDGELESTPAQVYDLQAGQPNADALAPLALVGAYKGVYGGRKVSFSLVSFANEQFGGTMAFDDQPAFKLRFQASRFYPRMGILVLVATTPNGVHLKLTMFFGKTAQGFKVQGMGFTDLNGASQALELETAARR